jgi:putative ABC transport system permease protein
MHDVRAALRLIRHRPWFCASVIVTLAIALGSSTAIFTLVHALVLKPLPFEDADRIVTIEATVADAGGRLNLREYRDLERDTRSFSRWAAYYRSQYNLTGGGSPEALTCTIGSSTLFEVLGVRPIYGDIWPASQDFTRQYLVVLSHRLWQQRFGGRPDVIGSTMVMDGGNYRVTGVLPPGFDYPLQTDVFRSVTDYNAPHVRRYSAVARLRPGISYAEAQAELDAFAARFARDYPDTNAGVALRATPLRDADVGRARPFLWLLLAAVLLLLVIAAVNVTNLLVSRAIGASGDAAVRLAMGASRRHLVRQSIAEAMLLTLIGAGLGGVGARWALQAITAMVAADLPPWFRIEFDATILLVSAAVACITAVAVGAMPALQAATTNVERVLRQESTRSAGSPRQQRARRVLLAGQAAFATLLLVSAALFATALRDLLRVDLGFEPANVVTFRVDPPWGRYPDIATTSQFYRRAVEELDAMPGVEASGTNTFLPFSGLDVVSPRVLIEGRDSGRADEQPFVNFQIVNAGYFRAMRIPLRSGRTFDWTDDAQAPPVAIVSERAARRFWGAEDPLGRRLRVVWNQHGTGAGTEANVWLTVVGVASNVRFAGVQDEGALDVYAPNTQLFAGDSYVVVRTGTDAAAARPTLRAAIDRVDTDQSFFDVQGMRARVDGSIWQHRVATVVLTLFAVVALVLAVIGTYAVTAHAVAAQRREIGIRLALGSSSGEVSRMVLTRWLSPVGAGVLIGAVSGAMAARALTEVLGTGELPDIAIPAAMPVALIAAAAIACYVPIRSMLRKVGITEALRAE